MPRTILPHISSPRYPILPQPRRYTHLRKHTRRYHVISTYRKWYNQDCIIVDVPARDNCNDVKQSRVRLEGEGRSLGSRGGWFDLQQWDKLRSQDNLRAGDSALWGRWQCSSYPERRHTCSSSTGEFESICPRGYVPKLARHTRRTGGQIRRWVSNGGGHSSSRSPLVFVDNTSTRSSLSVRCIRAGMEV